jgi:cytochrome c peroxidase
VASCNPCWLPKERRPDHVTDAQRATITAAAEANESLYMHNGYFKSLREVVHFYNTRDALPRCEARSPGEKVSCWPPPEVPININTRIVAILVSATLKRIQVEENFNTVQATIEAIDRALEDVRRQG